jgi:Xaa-Pro aminopeptidase
MSFLEKIMIKYKTPQEIEIMREAAQIVSRTLGLVAKHMQPGVTPKFFVHKMPFRDF